MQLFYRWLTISLPPPYSSSSANDVPDFLHRGMGDGLGNLARLKLEVREAAKASDMAQRPDFGSIGGGNFVSTFQSPAIGWVIHGLDHLTK